jgi:hypothetical protein
MAQSQLQTPGKPPGGRNYPKSFQPIVFDGFKGLNTKPTRPGIGDQEMFWCDNWMPLGEKNLRTLYDAGTQIYTAPSNDGIAFFGFGNISDTQICVAFLSSGGITQINTLTLASSTIAPANTILNTGATIALNQWGSQYILMAAPQANGYFIWDGSIFYKAGTLGPSVNISSDGNTYAGIPNMGAVGGHGSGARFTATVASTGSLNTITLISAGSGYTASDIVMVAFSGGGIGTSATAILTAVLNSGGGVGAVTVATGGSGYISGTIALSLQGGGGIGATATATVTNGAVASVSVTAPGQGYLSPPTVVVTDPSNPVAQATVPIMPFGIQGTAIEAYTSRVWVTNGGAITTPPAKNITFFTAPGNPADFSVANGGGSYLDNNSFARVGYHGLKQSNGFLYEIGDSSVDYISGVTTSGTPPITTFNNQNIDPQIGSPWSNTIQVFSRAIVMGNTFGTHALYGGAVQKVSNPLDGIYTTVPSVTPGNGQGPFVNGIVPSGAVAIVFGIHIYCQLLPIVDTYTGDTVNKILCWDGSRWFSYQPSITMIQIASQEINSVLTAYGTDGASIYPLFNTPSNAINKVVQSKQWDTPSYLMIKHINRVLGLVKANDDNADTFTVSVDTENGSKMIVVVNQFAATWYNNVAQIATWLNNASLPATWFTTTDAPASFVEGIDAAGTIVGLTFTTEAMDMTLISLMMTGQQYQATI